MWEKTGLHHQLEVPVFQAVEPEVPQKKGLKTLDL